MYIYNYVFGVWSASKSGAANPGQGFNPNVVDDAGIGFYKTPKELDGNRILAADYWNNVKVWNIIGQYLNSTINEMYTTFRVNVNNKVMPTFVARQKTYTSEHFRVGKRIGGKSGVKVTRKIVSRHMEMQRWRLDPSMVNDMDQGSDEAARINFVQIYTRTLSADDAKNRAKQAGQGNFVSDVEDIQRHGLRPYITTANFDFPSNESKSGLKGKEWATLVSDWLFAGHLKEGGELKCVGIQAPISVGDKLEFNNIVYEIDAINHVVSIDKQGKKKFRTNLQLSFGVDLRSNKIRPVYAEMQYTDAHTDNISDFEKHLQNLQYLQD